MMKIVNRLAAMAAAVPLLVSCLFENDMAYPRVYAEVLSFGVAGQESVTIDASRNTVSVVLEETADITRLEVTDFTFTDGAVCDDMGPGSVIDLSSPKKIVLRTYQDYEWTLSATQPVDRHVGCKGQVSYELFLNQNPRQVFVYIADNQDITSIVINDVKLEPEGAVLKGYEQDGEIVPIESFPLTLDCNMSRYFVYEYKGEEIRWQFKVILTEVGLAVSESDCNIWATFADVAAIYDGTGSPYFRYRASGSGSWTDVRDVDASGTTVTATIDGLLPETGYELMAVNGDTESDVVTFITEAAAQVVNSDFDDWYQESNVWYPNASADSFIWDTANKGVAGFSSWGVPFPTSREESDVKSGCAVKMVSQNAIAVLAAGNVYTGKFIKTSGLGAELDWGTPFTSRPLALKGWYKYAPKPIDKSDTDHAGLKGKLDTCQIQILLTSWTEPFKVNTSEGDFVDFDNDPGIIAYGKFEPNVSRAMQDYEEFVIDLEYRDLTRKPTYIVITACASKYGDYFTGGVGSTLFVDEFELVYDRVQEEKL